LSHVEREGRRRYTRRIRVYENECLSPSRGRENFLKENYLWPSPSGRTNQKHPIRVFLIWLSSQVY
jgi:hypothetical protein